MDTTGILLGSKLLADDIVPGAHNQSCIDGDRPLRGMGENEAYGAAWWELELGNQGGEIMAIGAEAMQPDDAGGSRCRGFDFNNGYWFQRHGVQEEKSPFLGFPAGKRLYFSLRQKITMACIMMKHRLYLNCSRILLLCLALVLLAACGQKGGLYLPDQHTASQNSH